MPLRPVHQSGINHVDTSPSQSGNVLREVRKLRSDFQDAAKELVDSLKDKKADKSPYAIDRTYAKKHLFHRSTHEGSWRSVGGSDSSFNNPLVEYNVKKLNIL